MSDLEKEALFEALSGAILPVEALPKFVQYLVYVLPHTWAYDLIRYYSFDGNWRTILPVWQEWALVILSRLVHVGVPSPAWKSGTARQRVQVARDLALNV